MTYKIKYVRSYWEVRDAKNRLIALAITLARLKRVGPWRPAKSKETWDNGTV